jgi:hypothetical protein
MEDSGPPGSRQSLSSVRFFKFLYTCNLNSFLSFLSTEVPKVCHFRKDALENLSQRDGFKKEIEGKSNKARSNLCQLLNDDDTYIPLILRHKSSKKNQFIEVFLFTN